MNSRNRDERISCIITNFFWNKKRVSFFMPMPKKDGRRRSQHDGEPSCVVQKAPSVHSLHKSFFCVWTQKIRRRYWFSHATTVQMRALPNQTYIKPGLRKTGKAKDRMILSQASQIQKILKSVYTNTFLISFKWRRFLFITLTLTRPFMKPIFVCY